MSGTATQPATNREAVAVSIVTQATFLLALAAACVIAWAKADYTLLIAMCGIAGTNATSVVNYWIGSSAGSARKTDLLNMPAATPLVAQSPP